MTDSDLPTHSVNIFVRASELQPFMTVTLPDDDCPQLVESVTKSHAVLDAVVIKTNGGARLLHIDDEVEVVP